MKEAKRDVNLLGISVPLTVPLGTTEIPGAIT